MIVGNHDATIEGRPLVAMTRADLTRAAPWIPDLADALAACAPMWVDLEIKNDPADPDWEHNDTVLKAIAPLVDERVVVTSFNPMTTQRAHELGMRTGQLLGWTDEPDAVLNEWPGYEFILPSKEMVPVASVHTLVETARSAGAKVGIWTIDDPALMQAYAAAGVDIVFTNLPDVAVTALGR